jgi:O-antigen ligase
MIALALVLAVGGLWAMDGPDPTGAWGLVFALAAWVQVSGSLVAGAGLARGLPRRIAWAALAWAGGRAIWWAFAPGFPADELTHRIGASAGEAFGGALLVAFVALRTPAGRVPAALGALGALALFDAALVTVRAAIVGRPWGLWNAGSIDAAVMAIALPVVALRSGIPTALRVTYGGLFLVGVLAAGGSTGVAATAVALGAYALARGSRALAALATAGALGGLLALPRAELIGDLLGGNGRYPVWRMALEWWGAMPWPWIPLGLGTGAFAWWFPAEQIRVGWTFAGIFTWAHNDWLQILIEQGAIGLALVLALYLLALARAWRDRLDRPWLFAALAAAGVAGLTQPLLRFHASALFIALLLREALTERSQPRVR